MNYASIKYPDIANGFGVRVSLFVSGCTHHCKGCFNPETWDFNYGKKFTEKERLRIAKILMLPWVEGLSILGGEPFDNVDQVYFLLCYVKMYGAKKDIWVYSGYTYEEILKDSEKCVLLPKIDVLVDGEFILEKKNVNLCFRGSENQRIIDVQKSLKQNKVVLYDLGE